MDDDRTARGFQRWLDLLDESEVQAQVDEIDRAQEQLHRRRDLLLQALTLKNDWSVLQTPNAPDGPFYSETPMSDGQVESHSDSGQEQGNEGVFVGAEQPGQNGW
jgi:hypothetical protein